MNYLKKKIKGHKKAVEDDEDYGDYIPPTPPHPDDLLKNQQSFATPLAVNNDLFLKNSNEKENLNTEDNNIDNKPKLIRKPKESKEEWQFFAQLSARVQETVAKTEKELEKIKATTKVEEIEKLAEQEYYFAEDLEELNQQFEEKFNSLESEKRRKKQSDIKIIKESNSTQNLKNSLSSTQLLNPDQSVPIFTNYSKKNVIASNTSEWIDFNQDSVELLDDEITEEDTPEKKLEEEKKLKELELEKIKKEQELKKKLKEDFGFSESLDTKKIEKQNLENIIDFENDYLDDPFNTELAEKKYESTKDLTLKIEKLEKELSSVNLNLIKPTTLNLKSSENKTIDRCTSSQNIHQKFNTSSNKYSSVPCTPGDKIDPDEIDIIATLETGRLSKYNSRESLVLSETLISRTNSVSSIHSILDNNKSRRNSTNPFDLEVDISNEENEDVPNVIAALTEDFYKTISNFDEDTDTKLNKKIDSKEKTLNTEEHFQEKTCEINKEISEDNLNTQNSEKPIDSEIQVVCQINNQPKDKKIKLIALEENLSRKLSFEDPKTELILNSSNNIDKGIYDKKQINQFSEIKSELNEYCKQDIKEVENLIKEQLPFDPFETIVEDDSCSNRQSVSSQNELYLDQLNNTTNINDENLIENETEINKTILKNIYTEFNKENYLEDNTSCNNQETFIDNQEEISSVVNQKEEEIFDMYKTVVDLSPTIENSPIEQDQSNIADSEINLEFKANQPVDTFSEIKENIMAENLSLEQEVNLDDLPPPPPELIMNDTIDNLNENDEELNLQAETISSLPKELESENIDEVSATQIVESNVETKNDYKQENESLCLNENIQALEKNETVSSNSILSNLVVDPFDTTVYNYETLKSFIPVATKDQIEQFNEKFESQNLVTDLENKKSDATYLDPFKSPLPQRKYYKKNNDDFDTFDPFITTKPPKNTPVMKRKKIKPAKSTSETDSSDFSSSEDEREKYRFVIKARLQEDIDAEQENIVIPLLPPPPQTPTKSPKHALRGVYNKPLLKVGRNRAKLREEYKRIHQKSEEEKREEEIDRNLYANLRKKYEEEHPEDVEPIPLYDEDTTELEEYENPFENLQWNFYVRYPIKKKITGNRFWKLAMVKFLPAINTVQLFNYVPKSNKPVPPPEACAEPPVSEENIGEPIQELLLQGSYGVSEISSQQYDEFGKIFTIKLQYKFYREKAAAETGKKIAHNMKLMQDKLAHFTKKFNDVVNINNVVNLHNKDSFLVATAMLQHTPNITELLKFGSHNYEHLRQFKAAIEHTLFKLPIGRDRALTYRAEEIQIQMVDEYFCEISTNGTIISHKARVRLFLLSFLNNMPVIEIGINDRTREGKEIVGRNDIMPITTEEWIRVENIQFHNCVDKSAFENEDKLVKLTPPDACTIEVMRFRVRPSKNCELPLLVNAKMYLSPKKVELRIEAMAAGAVSKDRDSDVIPCEDIVIKVYIPECWIYFFRVEKHTRFGSVKSASRRPGKIKGIERFLGATTNYPLESSLLEASAGQAKYEHSFHSLVWRIPRLPKEGQGAFKLQTMTMKLPLTESFDKIPDNLSNIVHVEFNLPATVISHAVVRSIAISQTDSETPPEKYANYVSKINYKLFMSIEHTKEENPYNIGIPSTVTNKTVKEPVIEEKDSDEDYDDEEEIDEDQE